MIGIVPNTDATTIEIHAPVPVKNKEKGKNINFFDVQREIKEALVTKHEKEKGRRNKEADNDEKKMQQAKKEWGTYEGVTDVVVGEEFNYVEFTYRNEYKVKYENTGVDMIYITPSQGTLKYPFEFMNSLFIKDNILDPAKKDSLENRKEVMKRIQYCINAQKAITEKCVSENRELLTGDITKPYVK